MDVLMLGIAIGWFGHIVLSHRATPTRGEGHRPGVPPVDWSKVAPPPTGTAIQRPAPNPRLKGRG